MHGICIRSQPSLKIFIVRSKQFQRSVGKGRTVFGGFPRALYFKKLHGVMAESNGSQNEQATQRTAVTKENEQQLPKLKPDEYRAYNHMAEHMDMFHENFRQTWDLLYQAASSGKRPSGMSIRQYINVGAQFCHHLTVHHTIEEQHIFPHLARKMPAFQRELQLLTQHKEIHKGLDKFEDYLDKCRTGEKELRMQEVREVMDSFGKVLWTHLDEEVGQLKAENMRKYWTLDEMKAMPM